MKRLVLTAARIVGWLIDHHIQNVNRKALR